jgi:hypothetical protein
MVCVNGNKQSFVRLCHRVHHLFIGMSKSDLNDWSFGQTCLLLTESISDYDSVLQVYFARNE